MNDTDIINSIPAGLAVFSIYNGHVTTRAVNQQLVDFSNHMGSIIDNNERAWTKELLREVLDYDLYFFCPEDYHYAVKQMLTDSMNGNITSCNFPLKGSSADNPIWIHSSCFSRLNPNGGRDYYVIFQDFTKQIQAENEIQEKQKLLMRISSYDSLTGVRNRYSYDTMLEQCNKTGLRQAGVAFADINGLKKVNDTLGHISGDNLISSFTTMLKRCFSPDEIYRISGDEFVIIAPDISNEAFAARMSLLLGEAAEHDNIASIGYIWDRNLTDVRQSVHTAEQLMYIEKQHYYETEHTISSKHRSRLLKRLLSDLAAGHYVMFLQPKSYISDTSVVGAEALVRLLDDEGNIIPPFEFIHILENEKLIPKVDYFMLEEVCRFLEYCKANKLPELRISVNMSRITIAEFDYITNICSICNKYNFDRDFLEFELTETNRTMDFARLQETIFKLRNLGFRISLDDIGTEYSSFPMLTLEGISTVKLDRSFIVRMNKPRVHKLLEHIIEMCHDLGLLVIAEGVETHSSRIELQNINCDMYQGYLLSKPIPAEEFLEKFSSNRF